MYIQVKVKAGQRREMVEQVSDNRFIISVKEKAERNLANTRVIDLIALHFSLPIKHVKIISGHTSPTKLLSVPDVKV